MHAVVTQGPYSIQYHVNIVQRLRKSPVNFTHVIFFFLPLCQGGLSAAPARAVSAVKNMNLPEIPRNINIGDINIKVPSLSPF